MSNIAAPVQSVKSIIRHFHIVYNALCLPLKNFCISLGTYNREIENNAHAKFCGVSKVHYGQCGSGENDLYGLEETEKVVVDPLGVC